MSTAYRIPAFDHDPAPVWLWDNAHARIVWANAAAVAFWSEDSLFDLIDRSFQLDDPFVAQLASIGGSKAPITPTTQSLRLDRGDGIRAWRAIVSAHLLPDKRTGLLIKIEEQTSRTIDHNALRYIDAFNDAPTPLALFGLDGTALLENESCQALFDPHSSLGARIGGNELAVRLIAQTLAGAHIQRTLTVRTKVGPRKHRIVAKGLMDRSTQFAATLVQFQDVTDRRAYEQSLIETKERMEELASLSTAFLWELSANQQILYASPLLCRSIDMAQEGVLQLSWPELADKMGIREADIVQSLSAATANSNATLLRTTPGEGPAQNFILRRQLVHDKQGELSKIRCAATPILSAPEKPHAVEVPPERPTSISDVHRQALDSINDAVLIVERDGSIQWANQAAHKLSEEESLTDLQDVYARLSTSDQEALESARVAQSSDTKMKGIRLTTLFVRSDEEKLPVNITLDPLDKGSENSIITIRDLTHEVNHSRALMAERDLERSANSAKSKMLAQVSHEFRTPLNALIGFSEMMIDERFGPIDNPRYRDYLENIHHGAQLLLSLSNDLLDIAKIEAGVLDLKESDIDLNAVIRKSINLVRPQARNQSIKIRGRLPEAGLYVRADERSVEQMLLNILSNAIKYSRPGTYVDLDSWSPSPSALRVTITDRGGGMTEQDIRLALQPYKRVGNTRDVEGVGLGLPLVKSLAEANRVEFQITSTPGRGTAVHLTFRKSATDQ